jgi:two-component system cell cycle sensor histidine kinase/response regulator CckA
MSTPLSVLVLEDQPSDAHLLVTNLRQAGFDPEWVRVDTELDFIARLESTLDLVLADYSLPQFGAPRALQCLRERGFETPFIIVSGAIGEEVAVAAVKDGATDFVLKNQLGRLGQVVTRALEERRLRDEKQTAEQSLRERTKLTNLTADLGLVLNRTDTLYEMLQHCAQSLVQNLDVAFARIWTLNAAHDILELQASAGMYTHLDGPHSRVPVGAFKIGLIAQERTPHLTNDVFNDPRVNDQEWVRREGMVAFAGYPLIVEDRLVGVMAAFARHRLTQAILDAMATVADQIAAWIERKQTEESLRFTQFTIDHFATPVFWADTEGRFFNVNDAACHLMGYTREELLLLSVSDVIPSVPQKRWGEVWSELRERGALVLESHLRQKGGREVPISLSSNLLQVDGRECSCMFMQDITERQRAEEVQRQSELRFHAIFNQTFEFVALLSTDGRVLEVNRPALDFRGLTLADVVGVPLGETPWLDISAESREQVRVAIGYAANGAFVRKDMTVNDRVGGQRTFDFSVKPVVNEGGQIELLVAEARDITDQKRLEEQFRQSQKMEAVGKLAGGVAHDFNNLLTIILGYSEVLQESLRDGDPLREWADEIHKAGSRAASLTGQLLAFSRKQVLVPVVLDLNALVTDMEKMLARLIGEDVDLAFLPASDLWRVRADAGQIEQVIMNLVVNARDAMPQGGKLTIETTNIELDEDYVAQHPDAHASQHVLLAVSDTGCGMDRATAARVFEPFFTTKADKGTGLGLATVFGIVKQSGGHVAVYSEPQFGTTFKIYLPRDTQEAITKRVTADPKSSLRGTETVLLVEDENGVRSLARVVLQRHGYKVLEARHGGEALLMCERCKDTIHLLATDVVMPNMSGRELVERLLPLRPKMKVLYMSGYMDDAIVRHGLVNAGVPFLQKPYSPDALLVKVREVLN